MTTVEILRKAKAELERRGWVQNPGGEDEGPCCAAIAINVQDIEWGERDAFDFMREAIGVKKDGNLWLANWNDAPGRTVEEVLAAFDKAIALAEGSETPKGGTR